MDEHQRISGALMAAAGGCGLLAGLLVLGLFASRGGIGLPDSAFGLWLWGATGVGLIWCCAALLGGVAAVLEHRAARTLLVPAALAVLALFPFGTLLGAYTLWAYWRQGAARPLPAWKRIAQQQRAV